MSREGREIAIRSGKYAGRIHSIAKGQIELEVWLGTDRIRSIARVTEIEVLPGGAEIAALLEEKEIAALPSAAEITVLSGYRHDLQYHVCPGKRLK